MPRYPEFQIMSRMKGVPIRVTIGPFMIGGNGPIYDLPLIELKRDGRVYLTFPEGTRPNVGDVYRIVRPVGFYGDDYSSFGRPRKTAAKVKILGASGGTRAEVQILKGSIIRGMSAEKD